MTLASLSRRLQATPPRRATWLVAGGVLALAGALLVIGPARLIAQIEGDRGIPVVAATHDIRVAGVEVNTTGKTGMDARLAGWADARKKAWAQLGGPTMSDGDIEAMVSAVVIEREQIGPHRYIARLTVVFDRAKAGQYVGMGTNAVATHSAPLLTIPVLWSGGVGQVYEVRGPWQAAWARFNPSDSGIDYVRPSGSGGDSLFITAGQVTRRSRSWWAEILNQFEASDVIMPEARLERQWPGGPVRGTFTARYGPDRKLIQSFTLVANDEASLPAMLDQAVKRLDGIYNDALAQGLLRPDPTLRNSNPADPALAAIIAAAAQQEGAAPTGDVPAVPPVPGQAPAPVVAPPPAPEAKATTITVQFASPDGRAVDSAMASVRSVPGVRGAATTSVAVGGTSVMRVTFAGSTEELRDALRARGWTVAGGGSVLSIRH